MEQITLYDILLWDTVAIVLGFILDLAFGDFVGGYHPVCFIGRMVTKLETFWYQPADNDRRKEKHGAYLTFTVLIVTFLFTLGILATFGFLHPLIYIVIAALICDAALAMHDLKKESMNVYFALPNVKLARTALSRIVGRDTEALDEQGVIRATVETVAENTTDGVVAPLFYLMLGGPALAMAYKAVNTMDSMIGYKNEQYLHFGRTAAILDDVVNFLPARLAAVFFILSAAICKQDAEGALRIWQRDRRKHESPNSAQTESACAGALGVILAGPASYFGKKKDKPVIGEATRPIEPEDIRRANQMMYVTSVLTLLFGLLCRVGCLWLLQR
ncbi:MAG: adenosylcobinamide-phosphate synthase CbiB [Lachnospiraceae bacterium]|nr:adenosylcobinamide-phosphate synthase CbiB [Lachnospiraceae bacterium]